jgi:hypothetical protein
MHDTHQTYGLLGEAITMSLPPSTQMPVTRTLSGRWSFFPTNPAVGHARFRQQLEQARLESLQQKLGRERGAQILTAAAVPPVAKPRGSCRTVPTPTLRGVALAPQMANQRYPIQRDEREQALWKDLWETTRKDLMGCEEVGQAFIHEEFIIPDEDPTKMEVEEVGEEMDIQEMAVQYATDSEDTTLSDPPPGI